MSNKDVYAQIAKTAHADGWTKEEITPQIVRGVLDAAYYAAAEALAKRNGYFYIPGLFDAWAVNQPAKPRRYGKNPFTGEEQWFSAKPATTKFKARVLSALKNEVLAELKSKKRKAARVKAAKAAVASKAKRAKARSAKKSRR